MHTSCMMHDMMYHCESLGPQTCDLEFLIHSNNNNNISVECRVSFAENVLKGHAAS